MAENQTLTTDDVTAQLAGLTEILTVLQRQYPQADDESLCSMLRGCVGTLDSLGVIWPSEDDAGLAAAAREIQAGDKAPDLLRMALAGVSTSGRPTTNGVPPRSRMPFAPKP